MKSEPPTFSSRYRSIYERLSKVPQQLDSHEVTFFADLLPSRRTLRVLDVGCGEGELAVLLAGKGHSVVASDISDGFLSQAREKAKMMGVEIETVRCDIEDKESSFGSQQFDAIFFMNVLEHLRSPIAGLEKLRDLIAEDGRLYIHTPNSCSLSRFVSAALLKRSRVGRFAPDAIGGLHLQEYDWLILQQLCNFIGLKVERIIPTSLTIIGGVSSRRLAKLFPAVSDTLLLECSRCPPVDVERAISMWAEKNRKVV